MTSVTSKVLSKKTSVKVGDDEYIFHLTDGAVSISKVPSVGSYDGIVIPEDKVRSFLTALEYFVRESEGAVPDEEEPAAEMQAPPTEPTELLATLKENAPAAKSKKPSTPRKLTKDQAADIAAMRLQGCSYGTIWKKYPFVSKAALVYHARKITDYSDGIDIHHTAVTHPTKSTTAKKAISEGSINADILDMYLKDYSIGEMAKKHNLTIRNVISRLAGMNAGWKKAKRLRILAESQPEKNRSIDLSDGYIHGEKIA